MTKLVVKKVNFSTYVKFSALLGASIGVLMAVMALLMVPMILLESPKESLIPIIAFLFAPILCAFVLGMYGVISYPFYLIIRKVIKKITLEVELSSTEYLIKQNNTINEQFSLTENNNDTNQGVE